MMQPNMAQLQMLRFACDIGKFNPETQPNDHDTWSDMLRQYFSPTCIVRQTFISKKNSGDVRTVEIAREHLARYFKKWFDCRVVRMHPVLGSVREEPINQIISLLQDSRSSWHYYYQTGEQVVWHGELRAHFNNSTMLFEHVEWKCTQHITEYLPREKFISSLNVNVTFDSQALSGMNPTPEWLQPGGTAQLLTPESKSILTSKVAVYGFPAEIEQTVDLADTISLMKDLVTFHKLNPSLNPRAALEAYVQRSTNPQPNIAHGLPPGAPGNPNHQPFAPHNLPPNMPQMPLSAPPAPMTPHMVIQGPGGASPAPTAMGTPQPPQAPGLARQLSQQAMGMAGGMPGSASTSPSGGKRRRGSVAEEKKDGGMGGKESPRVAGKKARTGP